MLLIVNSSLTAKTVTAEVQTAQIAPTVLQALGLDPNSLDAVRAEGTPVLPALPFGSNELPPDLSERDAGGSLR
jgi:hypothetical protein